MQSISHISLLVSGTAQHDVQERIRVAERAALVRAAKRQRPSLIAASRLVIGQIVVGFGRRIAGKPRQQERGLDAPAALKIAR